MIEGVRIKPLKSIPDERGRVMEILRCDDAIFDKFGQVYVTTVLPGVVKAWHYHKLQTDAIACVHGMIKLVMYDDRESSPTRGKVMEEFIGVHRPALALIPPFIYHGFKGISVEEAIIVNCPNLPYNSQAPDEYRRDPHNGGIPYDWARKDR